jgi:ornithine cyclodeaminase
VTLTDEKLLYLNSADIAAICADIDPVDCVARALRQHAAGAARVGDEGVLRWSPGGAQQARTLNMPGMVGTGLVGTKIINANTGNPDRGLPRADGLTLLFDPATVRPAAILQGAQISALRTAAVSTLAAVRLHAGTPVTLALLGAGPIAQAHADLMARHLEIGRVLIHDQVPARAQALAARLRAPDGPFRDVRAAGAEQAVRPASVVVTATTTTTAYVPYRWIAPGATVINVSLDDIAADAYLASSLLYVDDWDLVTADTQRLLGHLARQGTVAGPGEPAPPGGRAVTGTLGQLLAGECPGRAHARQVALVNPFGMAVEDLAIAQEVYTVALSRGLGTSLDR